MAFVCFCAAGNGYPYQVFHALYLSSFLNAPSWHQVTGLISVYTLILKWHEEFSMPSLSAPVAGRFPCPPFPYPHTQMVGRFPSCPPYPSGGRQIPLPCISLPPCSGGRQIPLPCISLPPCSGGRLNSSCSGGRLTVMPSCIRWQADYHALYFPFPSIRWQADVSGACHLNDNGLCMDMFTMAGPESKMTWILHTVSWKRSCHAYPFLHWGHVRKRIASHHRTYWSFMWLHSCREYDNHGWIVYLTHCVDAASLPTVCTPPVNSWNFPDGQVLGPESLCMHGSVFISECIL